MDLVIISTLPQVLLVPTDVSQSHNQHMEDLLASWHITAAQQIAPNWTDIVECAVELFLYLNFFSLHINLKYLSAGSFPLPFIIAKTF